MDIKCERTLTYTAGDRKHQVFYDYAKEMKIWRVPEAHLDTPEKYSDRGREYWQVWNREVPISEFVEREAPKYIQVRLHSLPREVQWPWVRVLAGVEQGGPHLRVCWEGDT